MEQPQFSEQLGLVISGLNLPGIGGPAFVAELHERLPGIPILVLGAPGEDAANYKGAWVRFLPGPFGGEQLLKAANDLLTQNV
jgi:DNA-binding NtrC family response regulator